MHVLTQHLWMYIRVASYKQYFSFTCSLSSPITNVSPRYYISIYRTGKWFFNAKNILRYHLSIQLPNKCPNVPCIRSPQMKSTERDHSPWADSGEPFPTISLAVILFHIKLSAFSSIVRQYLQAIPTSIQRMHNPIIILYVCCPNIARGTNYYCFQKWFFAFLFMLSCLLSCPKIFFQNVSTN